MTDTSTWRSPTAPFADTLGIIVEESPPGTGLLRIPLRPELGNRKGDMHGGVILTLVDIAASVAIRSSLTDYSGISSVSVSTNFIAPGKGDLTARSKLQRAGKRTAFVEVEVLDEGGALVATGLVTSRIFR